MPVYVDHKLKLTYEDLLQIPEDDPYRHEILDGIHVASPSPGYPHQTISRRIQFQLYEQIELPGYGDVVNAPMDVELARHDVVEPDIMVILNRTKGIITASHVRGVPDLLVEILSPSTKGRDRGIKLARYAATGVPEYWIVDPNARLAEVYRQAPAPRERRLELVSRHHEELTYETPEITARVELLSVWKDIEAPESG
jgi:Uma2 family endonuclease